MAEMKLIDIERETHVRRTYVFRLGRRKVYVPVVRKGTKINYKITNSDLTQLSEREMDFIKESVTDEEKWGRS